MEIMAAVHRIDIEKAFAIGMTRPQTPRDIALAYFGDTDRHYESNRTGPQPLIAFVRKWIFDHLPLHRNQTALLIADAPQFFHDGGRVTHISSEKRRVGKECVSTCRSRLSHYH